METSNIVPMSSWSALAVHMAGLQTPASVIPPESRPPESLCPEESQAGHAHESMAPGAAFKPFPAPLTHSWDNSEPQGLYQLPKCPRVPCLTSHPLFIPYSVSLLHSLPVFSGMTSPINCLHSHPCPRACFRHPFRFICVPHPVPMSFSYFLHSS